MSKINSYKNRLVKVFSLLVFCFTSVFTYNTAMAANESIYRYLDLPLINRDAAHGPGGLHPILPTKKSVLGSLLATARAKGISPKRYAALLDQYWLVSATDRVGIDLAHWNPRNGAEANRQNLAKSYRLYEDLQLQHRELEWAGMAGLVGADFGGGLFDFELFANLYDLSHLQGAANAVVKAVTDVAGPGVLNQLPKGLRALATFGGNITVQDLRYVLGMIMVMQKNIFTDLMPMHVAYVTKGIKAIEEFYQAGLIPLKALNAWRDVASKKPALIARGNTVLLDREQRVRIKDQWDQVRHYRGDVGEALTYATTTIGSPSLAGVIPMREYKPIRIDLGNQYLTTPLPSWNWSVFQERWNYITAELLPKYTSTAKNNWASLVGTLSEDNNQAMEEKRLTRNIPSFLLSAAREIRLEAKTQTAGNK